MVKAPDVRFSDSEVMSFTNLYFSTNQEIHGSTPCTFNFLFFYFFFFCNKAADKHLSDRGGFVYLH